MLYQPQTWRISSQKLADNHFQPTLSAKFFGWKHILSIKSEVS
jgi:hypothetical protein